MYKAYSVSWNLTQQCNLLCAHCYMSAFAGADTSHELSTVSYTHLTLPTILRV